jgi:ABC-type Fe3+ transport system permease subunit
MSDLANWFLWIFAAVILLDLLSGFVAAWLLSRRERRKA